MGHALIPCTSSSTLWASVTASHSQKHKHITSLPRPLILRGDWGGQLPAGVFLVVQAPCGTGMPGCRDAGGTQPRALVQERAAAEEAVSAQNRDPPGTRGTVRGKLGFRCRRHPGCRFPELGI